MAMSVGGTGTADAAAFCGSLAAYATAVASAGVLRWARQRVERGRWTAPDLQPLRGRHVCIRGRCTGRVRWAVEGRVHRPAEGVFGEALL